MTAEKDLRVLLSNLSPVVSADEFVFVSLSEQESEDEKNRLLFTQAKGVFKEAEGVTFILERQLARRCGLKGEGPFKCITCEVHSSLDAVGMTAAMSAALGGANISANVVAAYHHDHIFVQSDKASHAVDVLNGISAGQFAFG
jgi:hypothetical protein